MDGSVVICTRNRAGSLARLLASIAAAEHPADFTWEVVVVDNSSTDDTGAVLRTFADRLPLVLASEPVAGISAARNRGVAAAGGRYLIWTDDDVVVEPGWLVAYAQAFRRWPDADIFGGRIVPVLEEPVRPWFAACRDELAYLMASRDFGDAPLLLSVAEDRLPFGANYAVRAAAQVQFPYDRAIGAAPGQLRTGEETQVLRAMLEAGGFGYYVPDSVVRHMISPARQTVSYVLHYYRMHGETAAFTRAPALGRRLGGLPPWLWRKLAKEAMCYAATRLFAAPGVWVRHLKKFAFWQGYAGFERAERRRG
jgi:glycosyltransferase involved in cell wall biosynthesis